MKPNEAKTRPNEDEMKANIRQMKQISSTNNNKQHKNRDDIMS